MSHSSGVVPPARGVCSTGETERAMMFKSNIFVDDDVFMPDDDSPTKDGLYCFYTVALINALQTPPRARLGTGHRALSHQWRCQQPATHRRKAPALNSHHLCNSAKVVLVLLSLLHMFLCRSTTGATLLQSCHDTALRYRGSACAAGRLRDQSVGIRLLCSLAQFVVVRRWLAAL